MSCTHMATVGVKWLSLYLKYSVHGCSETSARHRIVLYHPAVTHCMMLVGGAATRQRSACAGHELVC